ncbi:hypothetical protein SBOR_4124 [Sclerotinia borealis F-4128]|uniref:Uncharacterized protein n=1 Tax=Sclerotinia borealis (strain F-4128) TaxID=1432307 RepID=W9CLT2_SCLBF|nr:hypothetical protein SBOR_4124 [Sclerotinia borealis F-4128]
MPTTYSSSEKTHILKLCTTHNIRDGHPTPRGIWPLIATAMQMEAQQHLPGGQQFDSDPWHFRHYLPKTLNSLALRWIREEARKERTRKFRDLQARRARGEKTLTEIIEEHIASGLSVRTDFGFVVL